MGIAIATSKDHDFDISRYIAQTVVFLNSAKFLNYITLLQYMILCMPHGNVSGC